MVPKPIIIRPAVIADADPVFSLLVQFATSYRPERAVFNATFPELISSPAACLLVAEDAGEVVGYALAVKTPTLYANGPNWLLQEIMVNPSRRSEGIGSRLLRAVVHHAQADSATEVVLATRRAGGFYIKHGFIETASYYKLRLANLSSR